MLWTLRDAIMGLIVFVMTAGNLYFGFINDYAACAIALGVAGIAGILIERKIIDRQHEAMKREYGLH